MAGPSISYREPGAVRVIRRGAWLEPLGRIEIGERVHAGAQFDVLAAWTRQGVELCVKLQAATKDGSMRGPLPWRSHGSGAGTSIWGGSTSRIEPADSSTTDDDRLASHLLELEAEAIRRSRGAWNHEVECLGIWGGYDDEDPWDGSRVRPYRTTLVTRRQPGVSLASLDREDARYLFLRLLPPLWTALGAARHGDLSLANLVLDREAGRFAIIDPGVVMRRHAHGPEGGAGGWMNYDCVFTTNAHAYPIFPPTWTVQGIPWEMQLEIFAQLAGSFEGPTHAQELITRFTSQHAREVIVATEWRSTPSVPDMIAMGVLYDALLADGHPVHGDAPTTPLWSGGFGEGDRPPIVDWVQRQAPLVLARDRASGISDGATTLVRKLIRCEIQTRQQLEQLVAAV